MKQQKNQAVKQAQPQLQLLQQLQQRQQHHHQQQLLRLHRMILLSKLRLKKLGKLFIKTVLPGIF